LIRIKVRDEEDTYFGNFLNDIFKNSNISREFVSIDKDQI